MKLIKLALASVFLLSSTVSAKTVAEIDSFCNSIGIVIQDIYEMKERGYTQEFIIKDLISSGFTKENAQYLTDAAFFINSVYKGEAVREAASYSCVQMHMEGEE